MSQGLEFEPHQEAWAGEAVGSLSEGWPDNCDDLSHLGENGGNVKVQSKEKFKVLAEVNGWSQAHAEGYVDGESFRRRGKMPSRYVQVGIDEYSLGFRAGYYERKNPDSSNSGKTDTSDRVRQRTGLS